MKIKLVGTLAVLSGLTVIACGDDSSDGSGGSATTSTSVSTSTSTSSKSTSTSTSVSTSTSTSSSSSSGGGCALPDTTAPTTCAEACSDLYDCGALTCMGGSICDGFSGDAAEKTSFVGDANGGCIQGCMAQMALISVIDPSNCESTVSTIKTLNAEFGTVCDNGFGGGSN